MSSALWNTIFSLFFAVLIFLGLSWLQDVDRLPTWISLGDFFLVTLATFRLVRLFTYDLITKFLRDWLAQSPAGSFLGTLSALINCPWCSGLWFSAFVVFFYYATPFAWPLILILALAGVASILQILANLIGWSAESKKRKTLAMTDTGSTSTCG